MPREPNREGKTPPLLTWTEALNFVAAAKALPARYRTPRLHLASHGIELALKSFLRAKGYSLRRLREELGHSLTKALRACEALGLESPSDLNLCRLQFLSAAHAQHEFRYGHLHKPPHMEPSEYVDVAKWTLWAAIPGVAAKNKTKGESQEAAMRPMTRHILRALG